MNISRSDRIRRGGGRETMETFRERRLNSLVGTNATHIYVWTHSLLPGHLEPKTFLKAFKLFDPPRIMVVVEKNLVDVEQPATVVVLSDFSGLFVKIWEALDDLLPEALSNRIRILPIPFELA